MKAIIKAIALVVLLANSFNLNFNNNKTNTFTKSLDKHQLPTCDNLFGSWGLQLRSQFHTSLFNVRQKYHVLENTLIIETQSFNIITTGMSPWSGH